MLIHGSDEYLFLISEIDPVIHRQVQLGQPVDTTAYFAVYWLINGRAAPDTLADAFSMPNQPYTSLAKAIRERESWSG
jgi:hypothetical protein